MKQVLDVLIIGAGPAGSFLAHKLARAGLQVTLLEKAIKPKRKVCGEYLCPLGVDLLEKEGLQDQIIGTFLPVKGMLIVTARQTEVVTEFPYGEMFHGVSVNREEFDTKLVNLAIESGATVKFGEEVKKISKSGEHWVVETNTTKYVTRILVGADGRKSIISKALDNDIVISERRVALHAYVNMPGLNIRQGEMHIFENGAYIGINPTGDHETNFSLVLDADELQALGGPLNAINHYINKSANLKARFTPFEDARVIAAAYPIQHRTKSIIPAHNVALIGDAAGFVDPSTGEGMYNALLSSQLLAEQIENSFSRSLYIDKKVFEEYERQYSKVLRNKIRLNRFFQTLIRYPKLVEVVARFLLTRQRRADTFIGIIGNIYSPVQGFFKLL